MAKQWGGTAVGERIRIQRIETEGVLPERGFGAEYLGRQHKKRQMGKCETNHGSRLVRVELARRNRELGGAARCALEVVLSGWAKDCGVAGF